MIFETFKKYIASGKMGFKTGIQYRFSFIVNMITTPLALFMYYFLWKSIYEYTGGGIIQGFAFESLIQYYVLSMIVGFFIWCDVDKWISNDVRRGHIITMFTSPMSFLSQHLSFEIGINSLGIIIEMIPVFIMGFIFFGLEIAPLFNLIAFLISVILAFFLAFFVSFNVGLSAFWLNRIEGIRRIRRTMVYFLSGGMIPLSFFPGWIQYVSHFLPFEYIRYVPIKIYMADYSTWGVLGQLGLQALWIMLLYFLSSVVYKQAFKQFTGAGV